MSGKQIVTLYENSGLTIQELATEFEMEEETIKMALLQGSAKYNKEVKEDTSLFNKEDQETASRVMRELMFSEDDNTKYRAAKFVINESKGRHDIINALKDTKVSAVMINAMMLRARETVEMSKQQSIDIESQEIAA